MVGGSLSSGIQGTRPFHLVNLLSCLQHVAYEVVLDIDILLTDKERTQRIMWRDFYRLDLEVIHISSAHLLSVQNFVKWPHLTAREA